MLEHHILVGKCWKSKMAGYFSAYAENAGSQKWQDIFG